MNKNPPYICILVRSIRLYATDMPNNNNMKPIVKTFLLFTVLTISLHCFNHKQSLDRKVPNYGELLLNNRWNSELILGLDPTTEIFKLTIDLRQVILGGLITDFYENGEFKSEISSWCGSGNDIKVKGNYKLRGKNKLIVLVKTVEYEGLSERPTEYRQPQNLTYAISLFGGNIILKKQK